MTPILASGHFGIIIKKSALEKNDISFQSLLQVMETEEPLDQNEELVAFGPHFGGEASAEFIRRLETVGLIYFEDFFDIPGLDLPEWCQLYVNLRG